MAPQPPSADPCSCERGKGMEGHSLIQKNPSILISGSPNPFFLPSASVANTAAFPSQLQTSPELLKSWSEHSSGMSSLNLSPGYTHLSDFGTNRGIYLGKAAEGTALTPRHPTAKSRHGNTKVSQQNLWNNLGFNAAWRNQHHVVFTGVPE